MLAATDDLNCYLFCTPYLNCYTLLQNDCMINEKRIDYFQKYGIILLVVSPTARKVDC